MSARERVACFFGVGVSDVRYSVRLTAALDAMHREDVVGTIAGDDTIFVLLRTETQAKEFAGSFARLMETGGF